MNISACIIIKNEEKYLRRCVESVQNLCNEIIVVDTGSTDRSVMIAKILGVKLFHFDWVDDFSEARNFAIAQATGDWILTIDADEVWSEQNPPISDEFLSNIDAVRLVQLNLLKDGQDESPQVRLFRNAGYKYTGRVHEQITPSIIAAGGKIAELNLQLIHDGYLNENVQDSLNGSGDSKTRIERNHLLLQKSLIETPNDPYLWFQLGMNFFSAGDFEKSKKALAEAEKLGIHRETEIVRRRFHLRRAQMLLREDHYTDALQEASAGYEVLPGPDVAYVALAASGWMNNIELVKYWGERFLSHSKNEEKIKEVSKLLGAMGLR